MLEGVQPDDVIRVGSKNFEVLVKIGKMAQQVVEEKGAQGGIFDVNRTHENIQFNPNNKRLAKINANGHSSIYSSKKYTKGVFEVKIISVQLKNKKQSQISIGISPNDEKQPRFNFCGADSGGSYSIYGKDGSVRRNGYVHKSVPKQNRITFGENDVIKVEVDITSNHIAFYVNNKNLGLRIADAVSKDGYYFAVTMFNKGDVLQINKLTDV